MKVFNIFHAVQHLPQHRRIRVTKVKPRQSTSGLLYLLSRYTLPYVPFNLSLMHLPDLCIHQFAVSPCPSLACVINILNTII